MARALNTTERHEARRVFESTIPYDKIGLTNASGMNDRPYTTPNGNPFDWESWDIHWGPQSEWDAKIKKYGNQYFWDTLIHELTHVWQGHNGTTGVGYIFNSLYHQAVDKDAYNYTAGQAWDDYGAEQQAHIVEDWYHNGCLSSDPLFPYIRDNIRKP